MHKSESGVPIHELSCGLDLHYIMGLLLPDVHWCLWCGCCQYLRNLFSGADHLCTAFQVSQHMLYSKVDASSQIHRVHACCYRLASLGQNGSGQHSCSCGTCRPAWLCYMHVDVAKRACGRCAMCIALAAAGSAPSPATSFVADATCLTRLAPTF